MPTSNPPTAFLSAELILLLAGLVLLWHYWLRPAARAQAGEAIALTAWPGDLAEFLVFLLLVVCGGFTGAYLGSVLGSALKLVGDTKLVAGGAGFQLGMLAGALAFPLLVLRQPVRPSLSHGVFLSGVATFLVTLPLATGANALWLALLQRVGVPAEKQDLVRMFADAKSPKLIITMTLLAGVVAPVTEELIFRAGLFRFLRNRVPRWIALAAPGLVFGALHVNWPTLEGLASLAPLVVLAIVFSIAYERTGRIGTTIVAHALFNLHTIAMILAGITD